MPNEVQIAPQGMIVARPPASFDPDCENRQEAWASFKSDWRVYSGLNKLDTQADDFKKFALLDVLGRRAREWAKSVGADEEKDKFDEYWLKIETRVAASSSETLSDFRFWQADKNQQQGETFDHFLDRVRRAARMCKFGNLEDRLIRSRIVIGIEDATLQRQLLSETRALDEIIQKCRSSEEAARTARFIKQQRAEQPALSHTSSRAGGDTYGAPSSSTATAAEQRASVNNGASATHEIAAFSRNLCSACGRHHGANSCPAVGQSCANCNGEDHFARVCPAGTKKHPTRPSPAWGAGQSHGQKSSPRGGYAPQGGRGRRRNDNRGSRRVWMMQCAESDTESDGGEYGVGSIKMLAKLKAESKNRWDEVLNIGGESVTCKLDTGADVSCVPMSLARHIVRRQNGMKMHKVAARLCSYFGDRYPCENVIHLPVACGNKNVIDKFYVLDMNVMPTLCGDTSEALGLIRRLNRVEKTPMLPVENGSRRVSSNSSLAETDNQRLSLPGSDNELLRWERAYPAAFKGEGCIKDYRCSIKLKNNYRAVANSCRPIPIAHEKAAKEELERMQRKGVIAKTFEPTEFVSHIVLTAKNNGKVRLCLDPTHLNKAIERSHHPMKRLEQITAKLAGARYFSTLDAKESFWQVTLDRKSSMLCTFITQWGRYRFLKMPYGISSASDEFQRLTDEVFRDMDGVAAVVDDLLVWADTKEEHDRRLERVLERCEAVGLVLNREKCKIGRSSVAYLGHVISADGVALDESRVADIQQVAPPQNLKELQAFLGMTNFVANFIDHYSDRTAPLRELLRKDTVFIWEERHENAFRLLKEALVSAPVLSFFDPSKEVVLSVDASKFGLGAVLLQEGRPIAYASRSLTETQQRYAQIEKEMLAIVFGCTKFHYYVYGQPSMTVETDHRPLQHIMKKPLHQVPLRLQQMRLALQRYDINVEYRPGKELVVADFLSRHPSPQEVDCEPRIRAVVRQPVRDHRLEEFRSLTQQDEELQALWRLFYEGWPNDKRSVPDIAKIYWPYRDEMHVEDGLVMRSNRLLVPKARRSEVLRQLHAAHSGVKKMKLRARDVVYWPAMNADIEEFVARCESCQTWRPANPKEPMLISEIPDLPWQIVSVDLFQYAGREYLIAVDSYSFYWEIEPLRTTSAKCVLEALFRIFQNFGIPSLVKSDNGPCFAAFEFRNTLRQHGIEHVTSSPYHPKGNATAERAVQEAKKLLRRFDYGSLQYSNALLEWRNTPRNEQLGSPAQRLMAREARTQIPVTTTRLTPKVIPPATVRQSLQEERERQKLHYDRGSRCLPPVKEGDRITIYDPKEGIWRRGRVVSMTLQPRSYIVRDQSTGLTTRRNRQLINKIPDEASPTDEPAPEPAFCTPPTSPCPPTTLSAPTAGTQPVLEDGGTGFRRSSRLKGARVKVHFK